MLNNIYRGSMINHPYGYALYEPQSSSIIKPGACGYIDSENGSFIPLVRDGNKRVDLGDPDSLKVNGLTTFDNLVRAEADTRSWGPKTSTRVNGTKINIKANASLIPAGIPADIGALYEFETSEKFGAILMTKPPVTRESIYGSTTLRKWCRDNTATLLDKWPEIKTNGLIIVTSTHLTSRADINAWQGKSKKVSIGFKSTSVDVFEVAPSSEWYKASSDDGWIASIAENAQDKKVVFFGGLYFKYRTFAPMLPQQHALYQRSLATLRTAPNATKFQLAHGGVEYEVTSEEIGHKEVAPTPPPEAADDSEDDENANF